MAPTEESHAGVSMPEAIVLSPRARRIWSGELGFDAYIARLLDENLTIDVVRIISAVMKPRELVWWSALCAFSMSGPLLPDHEHRTLTAVVHWVRQPSPQNYARTFELFRGCPPSSLIYSVAAAVYYFGSAPTENGPLETLDANMGVLCANSTIFKSLDHQTVPARQLAAIGMKLLKTTNHWNPA